MKNAPSRPATPSRPSARGPLLAAALLPALTASGAWLATLQGGPHTTETVALLASLFLSSAFSASVIWPYLRRLQRLARAAERLADGQLDAALPAGAPDELGRLTRALDRLRTSLRVLL